MAKKGKGKGKGKKGKGKGKKGAGAADVDPLSTDYQLMKAKSQIDSLEQQLMLRTDAATRAIQMRDEAVARCEHMKQDLESSQGRTVDISANMTRQYKAMQDDFRLQVEQKEATILQLNDKLRLAHAEREEMQREKDQIINDRETEIEQLEKKMEDMSQEFADMLKQTLERMSQKIEMESASMAATTDVELTSKLSEFKLGFVDL